MLRLLFIGDIVGRPGRQIVRERLPRLKEEHGIDLVVANGENAAGGVGITAEIAHELHDLGIDAITLGNHTWDKKQFESEIEELPFVVRPDNYPAPVPGQGWTVVTSAGGYRLVVVNLMGRVFFPITLECPFRWFDRYIDQWRQKGDAVLVDFHAEATSEKVAFGWHVDGRAAAVLGTHTHVQTADERVLPQGTAFISDVGMTGPADSVIGIEPERVLRKFLTQMPTSFQVARGKPQLNAVIVDIAPETGRARRIQRLFLRATSE